MAMTWNLVELSIERQKEILDNFRKVEKSNKGQRKIASEYGAAKCTVEKKIN